MAATAAKTAAPAAKTAKPATKASGLVAKDPPTAAQVKAPIAQPAPATPDKLSAETKLLDEVRVGFEDLRKLNPDELRAVISKRVNLLENVLKDREQRRDAIETAKMAGKLLDIRRERAVRIHKHVNVGSYWAAAATTLLLFVVMI